MNMISAVAVRSLRISLVLRQKSISVVIPGISGRSEEHTSELQSHSDLVCRLLLEKKKNKRNDRRSESIFIPKRVQSDTISADLPTPTTKNYSPVDMHHSNSTVAVSSFTTTVRSA